MVSLDKDIQSRKSSFEEFERCCLRVLDYLPAVINSRIEKNDYILMSSEMAGTRKFIRPVNRLLFISESNQFKSEAEKLREIFSRIKERDSTFSKEDKFCIDSVLYTIQQALSVGFDLFFDPGSARKHVGNRFEELMRVAFSEIGVTNRKLVMQIPYESDEGQKIYKCENDLIISPYKVIRSDSNNTDINEIVVSVKTTSKDRMGKMFIDKILLERFVNHKQKVIGIFLNDVQRKEESGISFTLVSGQFMVYSRFLAQLEGIYYLDVPPNARKLPLAKYIKSFSDLLIDDLPDMLSS